MVSRRGWSRCALALALGGSLLWPAASAIAAGYARPQQYGPAPQQYRSTPQQYGQGPQYRQMQQQGRPQYRQVAMAQRGETMPPPQPEPPRQPNGPVFIDDQNGGNVQTSNRYGGGCNTGDCYGGSCGCGNGYCDGSCGGSCSGGCGQPCYGGYCDSGCGCGDYCGGQCGDCCGYGNCGGYCDQSCCGGDGYYNGDCCGYGDCGCYECYPNVCEQACCCTPRLAAWADYLYIQATNADVTHAQQQDGLGGAGTVPMGEVASAGIDYDNAFRVGASVGCDCNSSVAVQWTYFDTERDDSLHAPVIPGGFGTVGSLVHHPGTAITGSIGPVTSEYDINFHLGEILYNRVLVSRERFCVGLIAGAQYGHLEQRFVQHGNFSGSLGGPIDTATEIKFDGAGLKLGIDAEGRATKAISGYGKLAGALMTGRFRSDYSMLRTNDGTQLALVDWKDDRIVPYFETEFGIACTCCNDCVRISTGYMFSNWLNTVTTGELIKGVQRNNYENIGDTLAFDGIVSRLEARW